MAQNKLISNGAVAALVFGLMALGNAGSTLYLPALIEISEQMGATSGQLQLTLACYLLSYGGSQFFYGPLSDAFGRKKILLIGISIFLVGTLISALSVNIEMLMLGRFIEGLGMGSANTAGYAIIRDVYQGTALSKVFSYASVFVGMTPIVAPFIGGLLVEHINWQSCFYALFLIVLLLLLLVKFKLYETNKHVNPSSFKLSNVLSNYCLLISSRIYMGSVLATSFAFAAVIVVNNMMPFLITKQFDLTPTSYGLMTIFTGSGYFLGAYASGFLAVKFGRSFTIFYGCAIQLLVIIISLLRGYDDLGLIEIILTFGAFLHGVGIVVPTATGGSMEPFPKISGSESALLGVFMYSFSAIFSAICSHVPNSSLCYTMALLAMLFLLTLGANLMVKFSKKKSGV